MKVINSKPDRLGHKIEQSSNGDRPFPHAKGKSRRVLAASSNDIKVKPIARTLKPNTSPAAGPASQLRLNGESSIEPMAASVGAGLVPAPVLFCSPFSGIHQFEEAKRIAMVLAQSSLVPENFRGEQNLGNCLIALEIANRLCAPVLAIMQSFHWVQGKAAWSSQFLISCLNASKRFSPLRYRMTGTPGEDSWGCVAWATDAQGEVLQSPEVTIKMAKAEGWHERLGNKWLSMPELMLRYRSATLFARLYAPELTVGIQTAEEVVDVGGAGSGKVTRPVFDSTKPTPKCVPKAQANSPALVPDSFLPTIDADTEKTQDTITYDVAPPVPASICSATIQQAASDSYFKALSGLIALSRHTEAQVMSFLRNSGKCDLGLTSLAEMKEKQPNALVWVHDNWQTVDQELSTLKGSNGL